jgi:hypothetical protein
VEVCDKERNVVSLDGFPPENDKVFCSHHHKPRKFVTENAFNVVLLLYANGHADGIYRWLDEDLFLLAPRYD